MNHPIVATGFRPLCSQGEVLSAAARASMDLRPRWVSGDLCGSVA